MNHFLANNTYGHVTNSVNGYMPYGANFVDILFNNLLEKGLTGLTAMTIFNLYLYLSLDKIKELMKWLNENIQNYFKTKIYLYYLYLYQLVEKKIFNFRETILVKFTYIYNKIIARKKYNFEKEIISETSDSISFDNETRYEIVISENNKLFLAALGNLIINNKSTIDFMVTQYINSDKNNHMINYILPDKIIISTDQIDIEIIQNINMSIIVEKTLEKINIKTINTSIPLTEKIKTISFNKFGSMIRQIFDNNINNNYFEFKFQDWNCSTGSLFNDSDFKYVVTCMYYNKQFNLLEKNMKLMCNGGFIDINDIKYNVETSSLDCPILKDFDNFRKEIEKSIDERFIPFMQDKDRELKTLATKLNKIFEPINDVTYCLKIAFTNKNNLTKENLDKIMDKFILTMFNNYLYQTAKNNDNNSISIYQLGIKYDKEIVKKENPEYLEWNKKYSKKSINLMDNKKDECKNPEKPSNNEALVKNKINNDNKSIFYNDYNMMSLEPEKIIEVMIETAVVDTVHIKSDRKPFDYLYLPEYDKKRLESYLSVFKNNKDLYKKMGIRHKGGIILSGEPGCGKTSTIIAIATYLGKDIYYMDLGKIKTNNELKLCIDSIKSNNNGAIIIFEDIDCMTRIVEKRTGSSNLNDSIMENMNTQNDALSLSFLLNILDGTLSPEDVMFIITTNHIKKLDSALIRPGRIDFSIEIKKCCKHQLQQIYKDLYHKELSENILTRFKEYEFITAQIILHLFHNMLNHDVSQEELLKEFLC